METIDIQYRFTLPDNTQETFDLQLDTQSLELQDDRPETLPEWTQLDYNQCPNCPLTIENHPCCPLAVSIVNIVNRFLAVSYPMIRCIWKLR
ncbi:MAG: DUF6901 family protein [bacterium]